MRASTSTAGSALNRADAASVHAKTQCATSAPACRLIRTLRRLIGVWRQIMGNRLEGKSIAILATDGFEEVELMQPLDALRNEGGEVDVIAPKAGEIQGFNHFDRGHKVTVNLTLDSADASD